MQYGSNRLSSVCQTRLVIRSMLSAKSPNDAKALMENVEDVGVLSSIDLVTETGSTKNLFESKTEENELEIKDLSLKI